MANPYTITITDGSGTANVMDGNYTVTSNTNGYLDSSIDPSTITVSEGTNEYNLTIAAEGSLTLHVTETGESSGTAVVGATFIRCDKNGNEYGTSVTTDQTGNAILPNLPYATSNAPVVYYKQKSSDGNHLFDDTLKNVTLESQTTTIEVTNALPPVRTFNLTDKNYNGLNIDSGTITLTQS